ncbi:MAG: hypothetical protein WDM79_09255 [Terricaulis sp.]
MRGYMRQGFPTPSSAARTLGAPVLGVMERTKTKTKRKAKARKQTPTLHLVKEAP